MHQILDTMQDIVAKISKHSGTVIFTHDEAFVTDPKTNENHNDSLLK